MVSLDDFLIEAEANFAKLQAAWPSMSMQQKAIAGIIIRRAFSSISELFPEKIEENDG